MTRLEEFIRPTQKELFSKLRRMFKNNAIYFKDNYILVPGDAPIMLLAHLDTVHKTPVKQICKTKNSTILMSPQGIGGDDRCGVYALVRLYRSAKDKPWLLFTCDEEIGRVGATKFCEHYDKGKLPKSLADLKLLVELDRKGENDAVYYDCENDDFEDYITSKGFKTQWGSFSDISYVAPKLGVAAVNLSSGYYNAHTLHEYINRNHLEASIAKVEGIIAESTEESIPKYKYIKSRFSDWDSYDYGYWCDRNYLYASSSELSKIPSEIRDEYGELLDFYDTGELDALREEYGDNIIQTLYEQEIGVLYGDYSVDEGEDDENEMEGSSKWRRK